ncbi:hypothetical protein Misp01_06010 [Microtetraspora sp. NBRC 13810]|uniref:AMIN-like domain-containing (lipo)protein n=1 Tax=Microtetraspora sp. NBRC 13810 TaxID=3030990 RepID=UPI0024A5749D|nr:hypothetical protein [Microtetraspora sp. NBRC 13810]GLW05471.1 hypothetical protein Misp01_06010 [Microtetraspora sp. NBRC 13810]
MNRTRIVLALIPLAMFAVACGEGGVTSQPTREVTTATATEPAPSAGAASPPGATANGAAALGPPTSMDEVEVTKEPAEPPMITGARYARHPGFDRVVLDIDGSLPGYTVNWTDEVVQDGSGDPVDVDGGAYLQIRMTPAQAHDEDGEVTWPGGPVFQAGLPNVRTVVRNGDFEGIVSVAIVLDRRAAFRVLEQRAPNRLVVDVAH